MAGKKEVSILVTLQDMASGNFKKMEASAGAFQSRLGSLKGELMGMAAGAGLTGMAGYAVKAAKDWGLAVDEIVDQTGAAGEEASKLLAIGKRTGLGMEEMAGMFAKFGKSVSSARDEMAKAAAQGEISNDVFSRLDLAPEDLKSGNLYEIYTKVAAKMRELGDAADFDRAAMDLFGRSGRQMADMLRMSDAEMAKVIAKAEKMGLVISSETAARWEEFDRNLQSVTGTVNKLAISIGNELLPRAEEGLTTIQKWIDMGTSWDKNNRDVAASAVVVAAEIGGVTLATKALMATMTTFGVGVINPWIRLVGIIGIAVLALEEYAKLNNSIIGKTADGQNIVKTKERNLRGGWDTAYYVEDAKAPGGYRTATGDEMRAAFADSAKSGVKLPNIPAADKPDGKYRGINTGDQTGDVQSLQNKVDNMFRSLNEKIIQETGTTAQYQLMKVGDEIERMQGELAANAKKLALYGIDVSVLTDPENGMFARYEKTMTQQIKDRESRARQSLFAETKLINAQLVDDKKAAADAEYEIAKVSLEGQLEEKRKTTKDEKDLAKWYNAELAKLLKERNQKYKDADRELYENRVQTNTLLYALEGKNLAEIDKLNKQTAEAEAARLRKALENPDLTEPQRLALKKQLADTTSQQNDIAGRDPATAYSEAMRRMAAIQTDYADIMVQSWHDIDQAAQDHFENMLTGTESMADGIKNIIRDMATSVQSMMAQMLYQQVVMQPLKNWWGDMLGGIFSGGSSAGGGKSAGIMKTNPFLGMQTRAKGGSFGPGWLLAGEEGPELMKVGAGVTGHVFNSRETRDILSRPAEQVRPIINFYITTPDVQGFRRSQSQLYSEGYAAAADAARRNR